MSEFERIVEFTAAYDRRNIDPAKNYGVHGVNMRLVLKGPKGAVHFLLFTNWHLPHVAAAFEDKPFMLAPAPADVGYHSPVPLREWQTEPSASTCDYLGGVPCYYGGSGLDASDAFAALVERGGDGIWGYLESYYQDIFEEPDNA